MSAPPTPKPNRVPEIRPASLVLLLVPAALLGYASGAPGGYGIVVAIVGILLAGVLRALSSRTARAIAPLPALAVLVLEAATAPAGFGPELLAGLSGLAFLIWLADDPGRPAGGAVRGLPTVALPALALGIAWSSTLFLPTGAVPLGVGGALLALALAAIAFLIGRPELFDREEARS
ncbi:MAG TPA: hypothetical protein VEH28_05780 [Thermoplasmata archaeon]|nr:hypothetical protein [Thermoplasmata archaeon]